MAIKTETKKELEQKADRLWDCYNAMALDFLNFANHANKAQAVANYGYVKEAEKYLARLEEAIKRYREGRPQSYQEG
jgi:hypothetical protein